MLQIGESGWTDPLPLDSGAAACTGEASSKPVLVRAYIPDLGSTHEMVARLDLAGSGFERTLVSFGSVSIAHAQLIFAQADKLVFPCHWVVGILHKLTTELV